MSLRSFFSLYPAQHIDSVNSAADLVNINAFVWCKAFALWSQFQLAMVCLGTCVGFTLEGIHLWLAVIQSAVKSFLIAHKPPLPGKAWLLVN
jgi:hypothetical protein